MDDYKLHHHVSQLISDFGLPSREGAQSLAEEYVEFLAKNKTDPTVLPPVLVQTSKQKIAETSKGQGAFLKKYDNLKGKNVRDLDSVVTLLAKLQRRETLKFLEKHAIDKAAVKGYGVVQVSTETGTDGVVSDNQQSGSSLSSIELSELKKSLKKQLDSGLHAPSDAIERLSATQNALNPRIPSDPKWLSRPSLTAGFVLSDYKDEMVDPIGLLPLKDQEYLVISDLLHCMQGISGQYVKADKKEEFSGWTFNIDTSLDTSAKQLVKRVLPLCSNFSIISTFIEQKSAFVCGMVNHALCAIIRDLMKNYFVEICQLEDQLHQGELTLHKLWFYVQPVSEVMEMLASITNTIDKSDSSGGTVLTLLHERTIALTGDQKLQEVCYSITQAACVPYFEILEKWIYQGIICDPYLEFAVHVHESVKRDKLTQEYNDPYWEQHYTLEYERLPVFLYQAAQKILNTGKYLNVLRQCGLDVKCPHAEEILYTLRERMYMDQIDKAYNFASKALLDLLIQDKDLMGRLRSVKHYFLLDQADFLVQFMDMADDELCKNIYDVIPTRLESLLELALRTSVVNSDPYKDDLKVELLPYDLVSMLFQVTSIETAKEEHYKTEKENEELNLTGLEAFSFDYTVEWPISLILSHKAVTQYQLLFRHLFYAKHVENQLSSIFIESKGREHSVSSFALCQRMLHFVQNLEYYMMFEVIEPNWKELEDKMHEVTNVDDVLELHKNFMDHCLNDCMLTDPDLLDIVHKLQVLCVKFANFLQILTMENESYNKTLSRFDHKFSKLLHRLLEKITGTGKLDTEHKLMNIVYRLDFNGFYSEKLEQLAAERSMKASHS